MIADFSAHTKHNPSNTTLAPLTAIFTLTGAALADKNPSMILASRSSSTALPRSRMAARPCTTSASRRVRSPRATTARATSKPAPPAMKMAVGG